MTEDKILELTDDRIRLGMFCKNDVHVLLAANKRLRETLPRLVDITWGEALDDKSVPSTKLAKRLINRALADGGGNG